MAIGKPAENTVPIGTVFLNKYRVEAILGSGGMGVVALCTHLQLNEKVAIKMLRSDVLHDEDAVERFTREAQAAAKLKSEYVARVSDVGRFENGVPYMVMEFLEGLDLDQLVHQRGCLPVPWAVDLMLQTAEALAEAHSISIVHRDVKPSNLFVTWRPDGSALIKVLDFGISKSAMGTDMQLTQTQSLLGTPAYMSPEQMRSARLVDARTDIWSLGTVMYEILEGRKPFEADSFSEMCVKVAVDAPAPMTKTPPELQPVVLRCLAKTPEQRYATMAEFGRDLIGFATDPHQANVLVERMHRMLRRSVGDWEGMSTSSGAIRTPMPSAKSQPVARPPSHQPYDNRPQFVFSPVTESTLKTPKKRSIVPWILGIAAIAMLGITIGVVASSGNDKPTEVVTKPLPVPAPVATAPPVPVPVPVPVPLVPPVPPVAELKQEVPLVTSPPPIIKKKRPPASMKKLEPTPPPLVETPKVTPKPIDPFNNRTGH